MSFDVTATRPVRDDVVTAIDDALDRLGDGEVMHAMDRSRILPFSHGGPPVWSFAMVEVGGARPYTLLVTYGFSEILSPEPDRAGIRHEYSLAIPAGVPVDRGIEIDLPGGRAADRLREAICGRVGFGRRLVAYSRSSR